MFVVIIMLQCLDLLMIVYSSTNNMAFFSEAHVVFNLVDYSVNDQCKK